MNRPVGLVEWPGVPSEPTPNKGLELTASSVRSAPAFGSSSGLAFGVYGKKQVGLTEAKARRRSCGTALSGAL